MDQRRVLQAREAAGLLADARQKGPGIDFRLATIIQRRFDDDPAVIGAVSSQQAIGIGACSQEGLIRCGGVQHHP